MRDTDVTGTLLRRPGPPKVLSDANRAVIDDPCLFDALDPDTPLLCLYEHATFSEGVVWDARRQLLVWSDVDGRRVLGWYPDGHVEAVIDATDFINGNTVDRDGLLVHVWTAPVSQGAFEGFGDWSGAVMYSAFRARFDDRGPRWVLRIGFPALRRAWIAR